jgi:serine/threonine protein kinase
MGDVWEARDRRSGRVCALKILHDRLLTQRGVPERFLREAYAAFEAKFSGHIVEVQEVVAREGELPYIVMELLEGEDISQILAREGAFEPRRAVDLVIQACNGLDEVHRRGLVHRDIKPGNLFVTRLPDGSEWVKLLDFGLVKLGSALQSGQKQITDFGVTLGTFQYMAPEQSARPSEVDQRADVFALGVVLYEMLSQQKPFDEDEVGLRGVIEKRKPTRLREHCPTIDPGLELVIARAMAVEPRRRWESMFAFITALEPFSSSPPSPVTASTAMDPEKPTIDEKLLPAERELLVRPPPDRRPKSSSPAAASSITAPFKILAAILGAVLLTGALLAARSAGDPLANDETAPEISIPAAADPSRGAAADAGARERRSSATRPDGGAVPDSRPAPRLAALSSAEVPRAGPEASAKTGAASEAPSGGPIEKNTKRPDPPPRGAKAFSRWIHEHHGETLSEVLDDLDEEITPCLARSDLRAGSKARVQLWINGDGSMSFRKSRPWLTTPARRCVMAALKGRRLELTGLQRFVVSREYVVPER